MSNSCVEAKQAFEFLRGKKIPVNYQATDGPPVRVISHHCLLDRRVHATIDAADALHEANRVPVQVIVDKASRVLKVQSFGEHIGGNENPRF